MGAGDSKLAFKKGIFRLSEEQNIAANDPYWIQFWELPETAEDVFTLFSANDIRRTRDQHLNNLETLLQVITSRLFTLRHHPSFPDPDLAPEKELLNCVRVLTRVLPYIYEKDALEDWEDKYFWTPRRRPKRQTNASSEVLFDESEDATKRQPEELEDAPPLGEELIDALIDLLFLSGFTIPKNLSKSKVYYAIWQSGVGSTSPAGTSKELEDNRIEILRCLLSLISKSMYMSTATLPEKGTKALTYLTTNSEKQVVLSVLCSLLNTTLKFNPATWRVPYDHVLYHDPRQSLVTYSLQFLLALVLYPIPTPPGPQVKNSYRHYLGRLHQVQDFQFLVDGMTRLLNQPIQANASLLPGSKKSIKWAPEMAMLFWETLQCNKRFRSFVVETDRAHDFLVLVTYYALEYRQDPSKTGVVRMCVFILQTLSSEARFGKNLGKRFETQSSLPSSVRIPSFSGTYADFLLISIHTLVTQSQGRLNAVYPALLAVLANIAPYLQNISALASSKLMQLFNSMSAPAFLFANETNHTQLQSLLESFNSIIEHQYAKNSNFIYAIIRNEKRFQDLRDLTLERGQEEINRKKEAANNRASNTSQKSSISEDARGSLQRPSVEAPEPSPSAFQLGEDSDSDDSDSDDVAKRTPLVSPTTDSSRRDSSDSSLPIQLRGMSEKARGKLPATAFTRTNTSQSLTLHGASSPPQFSGDFRPSEHWIQTWLPFLPLHTITILVQTLGPQIKAHISRSNAPGTDPNATSSVLEVIHTTKISGIDPSPIRTHLFEWSALALGWYESLLWGLIFSAEVQPQKGIVGVWNGTGVKLFRVQECQPQSPSLLAPRGGVDAIGTNIVNRLGSVTGRTNSQSNVSRE